MITIIFGLPGAGKTAFAAYLAKRIYRQEGQKLLFRSRNEITKFNEENHRTLTLPDRVPIYTNFDPELTIGYKKYYKPYHINPYYFGVKNDRLRTHYVAPYSVLFFDEAQRYYNSRKSMSFPDWVSRAFEIHRHYGLKIYLMAQRPGLIDKNIRDLADHSVYMEKMDNNCNFAGKVESTVFRYREFKGGEALGEDLGIAADAICEKTALHVGDIFKSFNSFSCKKEFFPPEGKDYEYFTADDREKKEYSEYFASGEPAGYRSAAD